MQRTVGSIADDHDQHQTVWAQHTAGRLVCVSCLSALQLMPLRAAVKLSQAAQSCTALEAPSCGTLYRLHLNLIRGNMSAGCEAAALMGTV